MIFLYRFILYQTEELESEMGVQSLFLVTENATVSSVVATASTLGHQFIRRYNLVGLFSDHCSKLIFVIYLVFTCIIGLHLRFFFSWL